MVFSTVSLGLPSALLWPAFKWIVLFLRANTAFLWAATRLALDGVTNHWNSGRHQCIDGCVWRGVDSFEKIFQDCRELVGQVGVS